LFSIFYFFFILWQNGARGLPVSQAEEAETLWQDNDRKLEQNWRQIHGNHTKKIFDIEYNPKLQNSLDLN